MNKLKVLSPEEASPQTKEIFDNLKKKLGRVPNIYAALGNSSAALKALLVLGETLKSGVLNAKEIEAIALVVGEDNNCEYCVAAHTVMAKMAGFSPEETVQLRKGESEDPKLKAVAGLAKEISSTRGRPGEAAIKAFFDAGYSEAAFAEVIGVVSLNLFTNYFNHMVEPSLDFPEAPPLS